MGLLESSAARPRQIRFQVALCRRQLPGPDGT